MGWLARQASSWELSLPLNEVTDLHGLGIQVGGESISRLRSERASSYKNQEKCPLTESLLQLDTRRSIRRDVIIVVLSVAWLAHARDFGWMTARLLLSPTCFTVTRMEKTDTLESNVTPGKSCRQSC